MSLVTITRETRLVLKIAAVIFVSVIVVYLAFGGYNFIKSVLFPPPVPPPDQKFGPLPRIAFPPSEGNTAAQYQINTVTGALPSFPDRAKIYQSIKPVPNILALQSAREKIKVFGITDAETKLSDTLYQWTDISSGRTIQYDIFTNNFDINSPYLTRVTNSDLPAKEGILGIMNEVVKRAQLDMSDIDPTKTSVTFYTIENNALKRTEKTREAQVARVDYFQADFDKYRVFYPDPNGSIMSFFIATTFVSPKVVEAHYFHTIYDKNTSATYPLKSADEAYSDLQKGNAYIVNNNSSATIDITDMILGYYAGKKEEYLEPIYIFVGRDFIAYVSAIANSSLR